MDEPWRVSATAKKQSPRPDLPGGWIIEDTRLLSPSLFLLLVLPSRFRFDEEKV